MLIQNPDDCLDNYFYYNSVVKIIFGQNTFESLYQHKCIFIYVGEYIHYANDKVIQTKQHSTIFYIITVIYIKKYNTKNIQQEITF